MIGWVGRRVPGVATMRGYRASWLRGDLTAGATVAAYLVPQVMAYAAVAGLPPIVGLWAVVGPLAVYALLGSSRRLSAGPESTTALMTAAVVGPLALGDPARYATLAAALAVVVGVLCAIGWVARLGYLADLLSKPVLVGYLAGVAVVMIVSQLGKVTGVPVDGGSVGAELASFVVRLVSDGTHGPTLAVSAAVMTTLWAGPRVPRLSRLPWPLIAVSLATVASAVLSLDERGVSTVGSTPGGVPAPGLPMVSLADLIALVLPAVGIAIVGYTDTVLTGRAFADDRTERLDANGEFLALGAANLSAGLLHGFPVSSSGTRTAIAVAAGARTQVSSLAALGCVVVVLTMGGSVLTALPTAALGALVIHAAASLVDIGQFRRFAAFRRSEATLAVTTAVAVLALGILYGILAAVALSVADLLRRLARPHDGVLGFVPGLAGMHDVDDHPGTRVIPGLVAYRYDAPLSFLNADDFRRRALAAVDASRPPAEWFLMNAEANVEIDVTSADALEELRQELARRGVVFAMARVKQELRDQLAVAGLLQRIGESRVFPTLPTAVAAYRDWRVDRGR